MVQKMVGPFQGRRHIVVMNNFFALVYLFYELVKQGIYVTRIICSNCIEIPVDLKSKKVNTKLPHSSLL